MHRSVLLAITAAVATVACSSSEEVPGGDGGPDGTVGDGGVDAIADATIDVPWGSLDAGFPWDVSAVDASISHPCDLPGSIQHTASGVVVVPGAASLPDVGYVSVPTGFCVHYFATVPNARQIRFAPGGELFVASPTQGTTGGGPGGRAAIIVLSDDDRNGVADPPITFASNLPQTQGLLFYNSFFYYQDGTKILRVPYAIGDRAPSGAVEQVADITLYQSGIHWPKVMDVADDGTIYVGNGGDQGEQCVDSRPFHGGILKIDGNPGGTPVAKGFRNPIAIRCSRGKNLCFALELAKDYSMSEGGREKLAPIRAGDDWGFPCCATKDLPYQGISPAPDCSGVVPESAGFLIGDTPFGVDFESGSWPAPWTGRAFVAVHGNFSGWLGARLVAVAMDPVTGLPVPSSDTGGTNTGGMADFATGWDDGTKLHGRPSAVTFSTDGRLFLANDNNGHIVWIAPL